MLWWQLVCFWQKKQKRKRRVLEQTPPTLMSRKTRPGPRSKKNSYLHVGRVAGIAGLTPTLIWPRMVPSWSPSLIWCKKRKMRPIKTPKRRIIRLRKRSDRLGEINTKEKEDFSLFFSPFLLPSQISHFLNFLILNSFPPIAPRNFQQLPLSCRKLPGRCLFVKRW